MAGFVAVAGNVALGGLALWAANQVCYELREDALCIEYFGCCVRRVPYSNIESVRRGYALWNEHYNRLSTDPCITLRLRRGVLSKNLVINPRHTDDFMARLRSRLSPAAPGSAATTAW